MVDEANRCPKCGAQLSHNVPPGVGPQCWEVQATTAADHVGDLGELLLDLEPVIDLSHSS